MQYALQVFEYEDRSEFRIIDINGEPWFVLGDVCKALDIKNPSDAATRLDEDEKGVAQTDTLWGKPKYQDNQRVRALFVDIAVRQAGGKAIQEMDHV